MQRTSDVVILVELLVDRVSTCQTAMTKANETTQSAIIPKISRRETESLRTVISSTHGQQQNVDAECLGEAESDGDGTSLPGQVRVLVVDGLGRFGGGSVVPVVRVGDLERSERKERRWKEEDE